MVTVIYIGLMKISAWALPSGGSANLSRRSFRSAPRTCDTRPAPPRTRTGPLEGMFGTARVLSVVALARQRISRFLSFVCLSCKRAFHGYAAQEHHLFVVCRSVNSFSLKGDHAGVQYCIIYLFVICGSVNPSSFTRGLHRCTA